MARRLQCKPLTLFAPRRKALMNNIIYIVGFVVVVVAVLSFFGLR